MKTSIVVVCFLGSVLACFGIYERIGQLKQFSKDLKITPAEIKSSQIESNSNYLIRHIGGNDYFSDKAPLEDSNGCKFHDDKGQLIVLRGSYVVIRKAQ